MKYKSQTVEEIDNLLSHLEKKVAQEKKFIKENQIGLKKT
jgi:hypothetical protein